MLQVQDPNVDTLNGDKIVQMKDTENQTVQLMFPQDRNPHGKVFGGILMRLVGLSYTPPANLRHCKLSLTTLPTGTDHSELAFTNAALFAAKPMRFLALDQITFRLPVPIGAVLRLSSKVVHTTRPDESTDGEAKAHLMVRAEVEEIDTGVSGFMPCSDTTVTPRD